MEARRAPDGRYRPAWVERFDPARGVYAVRWADGDPADRLKRPDELRAQGQRRDDSDDPTGAPPPSESAPSPAPAAFRRPTESDLSAVTPPPGYRLAGFAVSRAPVPEGARCGR